jgi:hypothetical protein
MALLQEKAAYDRKAEGKKDSLSWGRGQGEGPLDPESGKTRGFPTWRSVRRHVASPGCAPGEPYLAQRTPKRREHRSRFVLRVAASLREPLVSLFPFQKKRLQSPSSSL